MGSLNEEEFKRLQAELKDNHKITSLRLGGDVGNVSDKVKDYVGFICGRNFVETLAGKEPSVEEAAKFIEIFKGVEPTHCGAVLTQVRPLRGNL